MSNIKTVASQTKLSIDICCLSTCPKVCQWQRLGTGKTNTWFTSHFWRDNIFKRRINARNILEIISLSRYDKREKGNC